MECVCKKEMFQFDFSASRVFICRDCNLFDIEYFECSHEKYEPYPIRLTIVGGRKMIKMYCPDCKHTFGEILKNKPEYKDIPEGSNEKHHEYWKNIRDQERIKTAELTEGKERLKQILSQMEFSEKYKQYQKYLLSNKWKNLREVIMKRDHYKCQICFKNAEEIHHLTYVHLGNEYLFELVALCKKCHKEYYPKTVFI